MPKLLIKKKYIQYCPKRYKRYFIHIDGTFGNYLSKYSSKSRTSLKRKVKKIDSLCENESNWKEYKTTNEFNVFFSHAGQISKKTYQEKLLGKGLPNTEVFREYVITQARSNSVRGYI